MVALGVPWPQPSMWRERIVGREISDEVAAAFEAGKVVLAKSTIKRKENAILRANGLLPPLVKACDREEKPDGIITRAELDAIIKNRPPIAASRKERNKAKKARKRERNAASNLARQIAAAETPKPQAKQRAKPRAERAPKAANVPKLRTASPVIVEGVDVRSKEFLRTWTWRELRYATIKRYGPVCQCCGATPQSSGEPIQIDHIKPRSLFPELALDPENLGILCGPCNQGKSNKDFTDWRPVERDELNQLDADQAEHMRAISSS